MKIFIAVVSKNRPKTLIKGTLPLVSRSGYNYKVYLPKKQELKYREQLAVAESRSYLYLPEENFKFINKTNITKYIKETVKKQGFDLLAFIPDNLKGGKIDKRLLEFCKEIEKIRVEFEQNEGLRLKLAENIGTEAYLVRI